MAFGPAGPLRGTLSVPGDKSISHRALMLAALAVGQSRVEGLSEGTDVVSTMDALRAMGARIALRDSVCTVDGVGVGALLQPRLPLEMGNSGTSTRLLMGLVATHNISATFTGDASLRLRPMDRVAAPLRRIGAEIAAAPGDRLPFTVRGISPAAGATHRLGIASAQVKSALLLAGLNCSGVTRVIQHNPTRDHLERLLKRFGADIELGDGEVALRGEAELRPQNIAIAGDPSAAAFLAVAALIVPGSEIRIEGVGINPHRIGLFTILREMRGDLAFENERMVCGEPVADLIVRHSKLTGVDVPPEMAASMIDEFPILFVASAFAEGISRTSGLGELRIKESDRITVMVQGLRAIGVAVDESADGLVIHGCGGDMPAGGAQLQSCLDHRIAMSFAVAGLHCRQPVRIDDMAPIATSFPDFPTRLRRLQGAE